MLTNIYKHLNISDNLFAQISAQFRVKLLVDQFYYHTISWHTHDLTKINK
jgi:hypothetical protein